MTAPPKSGGNGLARAVQLHRAGRRAQAQPFYERSLLDDPLDPQRRFLFGLCLLEQGKLSDGEQQMQAVLQLGARHVGALHALGKVHALRGETAEAEHFFRQALLDSAAPIDSYIEYGNLLARVGRLGEAVEIYRRGLNSQPNHAGMRANLGNALSQQGQRRAAVAEWQAALRLKPNLAAARAGLALELRAAGNFAAAAEEFGRLVALEPNVPEHHYNLAVTYRYRRRFVEAIAALRRALELAPDFRRARIELARVYQAVCAWRELTKLEPVIAAEIAAALAGRPCLITPYFSLSLKMPPTERKAIAVAAAAATAEQVIRELGPTPLEASRHLEARPLRIGYLSSDFRDHAVAHLMQSLIRLHDRQEFAVYGYSIGPDDGSEYRHRIAADCDKFVDLSTLSNAEAARSIHADGINILVDLNGYTALARPQIAAMRPAPVQATFLGFPGTSGARFFDYVLTDRVVTPMSAAADYVEAFCHLPQSYQVTDRWQRIGHRRPTRAEEGLPLDGFVFCSFCAHFKIEADLFALWMRLVRRVPGSVLWLLGDSPEAEWRLRTSAGEHGVDPLRLVFASRKPKPDHLARLQLADLCLDTLTYGAHTTASDALWVGVPFMTRPGDAFASRVGASVLTAAGLPELIVDGLDAYEHLAIRLAADAAELARLRGRVNDCRRDGALFDTPRWVRGVEKAYRAMWSTHQEGRPPSPIAVDD